VKISKRPSSIPILNIHFALSGRGLKVPAGPMISPRPGPTLDIDVTAPDIAVVKSNPTNESASARTAKDAA